jgi:hypothetical protein
MWKRNKKKIHKSLSLLRSTLYTTRQKFDYAHKNCQVVWEKNVVRIRSGREYNEQSKYIHQKKIVFKYTHFQMGGKKPYTLKQLKTTQRRF